MVYYNDMKHHLKGKEQGVRAGVRKEGETLSRMKDSKRGSALEDL